MKKYENVKIEVLLYPQQDIFMASNEDIFNEEIIKEPNNWLE